MRILIDECLNWRISRALPGHYAVSAQKMGWSGVKNGELLRMAVENGFDVFITGDRNLSFQQHAPTHLIAIIVLEADGTQLQNFAADGKSTANSNDLKAVHDYQTLEFRYPMTSCVDRRICG